MAVTTVDTLLVRIEADLKDVNRDLKKLDQRLDNTSKQAKKGFSVIGTTVKAVLGAVVVREAGRATMALAEFGSQVEEMQSMSGAVFAEFTDDVRRELEGFAKAVGRSRFDLEGMAASVQDTFVPLGFARDEAAKMSVALTRLAVDVGSFKNEQDPAVMQAFTSALVGNHEAVRRFGIVITEGSLKQELFRMGITKNIDEVTNQEKVQARLNLIYAGTTDAQGDAARTANSYANRVKGLSGSFDELKFNLSENLMPVFTEVVIFFDELTKGINRAGERLGIFADQTEKTFDDIIIARYGMSMSQLIDTIDELREAGFSLSRIFDEELYKKGLIVTAPSFDPNAVFKFDNASKDLEETIADLRIELTELEQIQRGATEADIEAQRVANEHTDANLYQIKTYRDLLESIASIKKEIEDKATADEKAKTEAESFTETIRKLSEANNLLAMELRGVTDAELIASKIIAELSGLTAEQEKQIRDLVETQVAYNTALDEQESSAQKASDAEKERQQALQDTQDTIKDLTAQANLLRAERDGATEAELEATKVLAGLTEVREQDKQEIIDLIEFNAKLRKQIDETNDTIDNAEKFIDGLTTETEKLEQIQQDLNDAYLMGKISLEEYKEAQEEVEAQMRALDPMFATMISALESMSKSVSDEFAEMLMSGKLNLESLQDIFRNFVKVMISKAIELAIINRIINAAFGLTGSNALQTIPIGGGAAGGGAISGPRIVGERGPELFIPSSTGTIKNNMDTKNILGGSGGSVVNQTINIETGVSQTVRAEIMTMMPMIKQTTMQAVADSKRRGGQIASAFGT